MGCTISPCLLIEENLLHIGIVLLSWQLGGAEKRFGNLFKYLSVNSAHRFTLVINRFLREKLNDVGISLKGDRVRVLLDNQWGKHFDRFPPNLRYMLNLRIPGPNFLAHRLFEKARSTCLRREGHLVSQLDFDVIHYVYPYFVESWEGPSARVLSCQITNPKKGHLKNRFFLEALYGDGYFDILSERIKAVITAETGVTDDRRLCVSPCSFVDYSRTYVATKEPLLAFLGRLDPLKNPLLFVEVVRSVRQVYPRVRAVMLGDGLLRKDVERQIRRYGLDGVVTVKFHPRPEVILSQALVFISIQSLDNYPSQSLIEAMACGCAVVASDFGETYKLVSDDTGFRVGLDVESISEKVLWLLNHSDVAYQMGLRARKKVMSEHTIERFGSYLEELYKTAYTLS
jgi:glycosyltransferase involved in cell wall biosynthesis